MKKILLRIQSAVLLFASFIFILLGGGFFQTEKYEKCNTGTALSYLNIDNEDTRLFEEKKISSRFYELIFGKKDDPIMLCPSGAAFGILINEDGICVTSSESGCPILKGDRILSVSNKTCQDSKEVYEAVRGSGGAPLKIRLIRQGEEITVTATPKYKDGEYRLGITLRSQSAGIGTVTFINPETLSFGGLGHSISDAESGTPVPIKNGFATTVLLGGCKKGEPGKAGELSGILKRGILGSIIKNTECGVFGVFETMPTDADAPIPVSRKNEVKCGEAEIIATVKNGMRSRYKIEITEIDSESQGSKSFKIKVTDPILIEQTGGIVRGMSGSPIIQNGKLVGAVTHVMVADPTEGYGIFIENMLNAAESQVQPKAA